MAPPYRYTAGSLSFEVPLSRISSAIASFTGIGQLVLKKIPRRFLDPPEL